MDCSEVDERHARTDWGALFANKMVFKSLFMYSGKPEQSLAQGRNVIYVLVSL